MDYPGYRKMELSELQKLQVKVMKELHDICAKHNICYYLIAGSLLGAVRHGGFIPWDDDIDIALMRKEYEHLKTILIKELDPEKYFLQCYDTDIDYKPALMRLCIKNTIQDNPKFYHLKCKKHSFIDIFPIDNVPSGNIARKIQAFLIKNTDRLQETILYGCLNVKQYSTAKKILYRLVSCIPFAFLRWAKENCMKIYSNQDTEYVACMQSHYSYDRQTMHRSIYGTPTLYKFEDQMFFIPEKHLEYLEKLYGENYMKIPPVEKRERPIDVYIKDGCN